MIIFGPYGKIVGFFVLSAPGGDSNAGKRADLFQV